MENLIVEAYRKAQTKKIFAVTTHVERLLKKYYSLRNKRNWITIGEVKRILERHGLVVEYDLTPASTKVN